MIWFNQSIAKSLRHLFFGGTAIVLAAITALTIDGLTDKIARSDVIIVLGNEVLADGTPSDRLAARLDKAHDLFKAEMSEAIIVSSGINAAGYDEADVMTTYLVDRDIPRSAIINDSAGVNTRATGLNAKAIMKDRGWRSAIAVSQYYHISRTKLALRQAGIETVYNAHAEFFELLDIYSIFREIPAYVTYLVE
ncbi:MAG: YdcF family protein [Geminicoccales bacterium]